MNRANILPQELDVLPDVGDGATVSVGSDRYAFTVIDVKKRPKRSIITIQSCHTKATGDYYGDQTYDITPNPEGRTKVVTFQQGHWCEQGKPWALLNFHRGEPGMHYSDPSY